MQQGSEEWKQARCGRVTASRVHDIVAITRSGGYTSGRKNYLAELVCERLTGTPAEHTQSAAMAYGTETEPEARFAYAFKTDMDMDEVGFIPHPTITMAGASPDGIGRTGGLVEIKCPNSSTHMEFLLTERSRRNISTKCNSRWLAHGRQWCDFVSSTAAPRKCSLYLSGCRATKTHRRARTGGDEIPRSISTPRWICSASDTCRRQHEPRRRRSVQLQHPQSGNKYY